MIGLGFAGVGGLGDALLRDLPKQPGLRLAAVQDVDPAAAAAAAARHGSPWHGTDYAAMLAQPGVDAVVICTPNALHVPQARAALAAGRHVLVQKPLALRHGEAADLVERARRADRILFVDYSYRFLATTAALRGALPAIGPLRRASGDFHNVHGPGKGWFFDPALSGGGALTDLGVHLIDLALTLLAPARVRIERVALSHRLGHPVEDAAELDLRLDDAPLAVRVSWNADRPRTEIALRLEGARGRLEWENVDGSFFRFRVRRGGAVQVDQETTLREDTLRAFAGALARGSAEPIDLRVYRLLDQAYGRAEALADRDDAV